MTVHLRPHHLFCLLTYIGKGYSADFVRNYNAVAARLRRGEAIRIISGADDICAPLLGGAQLPKPSKSPKPHCLCQSVTARDGIAAAEISAALGWVIEEGVEIADIPQFLRAMREAFADVRRRRTCLGCEWRDLCQAVADSGYKNAALPG